MKDFESRSYLLQFICTGAEHVIHVSEVPLANGATAYIVKMNNYRSMFFENGTQWTVKSKALISDHLQKQIIKEIQLHQRQLNFINQSSMHMRAVL